LKRPGAAQASRTFRASNGSGWLPHLDLTAAGSFTAASGEHAHLFQLLNKQGTLTMRAQLDLWNMLRPATQPGSKLDFSVSARNSHPLVPQCGQAKGEFIGKNRAAESGRGPRHC